jgi:hypothetical protein
MADSNFVEKGVFVQDAPVFNALPSVKPPFDRAAERRLLRKLDLRILPVLWILYLVNFIDRCVTEAVSSRQPTDNVS